MRLVTLNTVCYVCGNESTQDVMQLKYSLRSYLILTETHGLHFNIQSCPVCGYCAPDITHGSLNTRKLVKGGINANNRRKDLLIGAPKGFICASELLMYSKSWPLAGWCSLQASFISRSLDAKKHVDKWRKKAILCFEMAKKTQQPFANNVIEEALILADLYRQDGKFDMRQKC